MAGSNEDTTLPLIKAQQDQVIADLTNPPPIGRMAIHIIADIDSGTIRLRISRARRGDVLTIPKQAGFVLVTEPN